MQKKFLLLPIFLILTISLSAQNFNGGLILGFNMSQLDGDNHGGYTKLNLQGGAFVSLQVSEHSSFQMEMEYIGKGSHVPVDSSGNEYLYRFHYLEIPLLYQYTFARRFQIEAGPAADVLLGSYEETNGIESPSVVPLRPVTLSGIAGFSGYITPHLKGNIRFNYSLLSIRKPVDTPPSSYRYILFEKGQYNNVIEFSLLWYFRPKDLR
ncbi:MAG: porin family protein [Syntrophothermus sp.]